MKILVIGDFHGKFPKKLKEKAKEVDFILCTGDFGGSKKLLNVIFKYLGESWWKKIEIDKAKKYVLEDYNSGVKILKELDKLNKPVYIISGNWDFISKSKLERTAGLNLVNYPIIIRNSKNLKYWKRGIRRVHGINILAFGGQVTAGDYIDKKGFYKNKPKKLMKHIKDNKKETEQIMKYGRKDVDILFAHYPPYGYFDVVRYKGENPMNGKRVGFKGYTEYIKKYQPKLFISGHMHEYQGLKRLGRTNIIATGAAMNREAVIIDINDKKINIKFIK